ncbi:MAG: hypothetical protein KDA46_00630 [Parvularculaceae bacterium]|nr:hypothetical protein [Parvularculaceae bacterium]
MPQFPGFATGDGYDAFDEFEALEVGQEREWSLTLARLCQVMRLGVAEAASDNWSPPDLFMCKFGRISTIYAVKTAANIGADVLVLVCGDFGPARNVSKYEATARVRLAEAIF